MSHLVAKGLRTNSQGNRPKSGVIFQNARACGGLSLSTSDVFVKLQCLCKFLEENRREAANFFLETKMLPSPKVKK